MRASVALCLVAVTVWGVGSISCCAHKTHRKKSIKTRSGTSSEDNNGMIPLTFYVSFQEIETVSYLISRLLGYSTDEGSENEGHFSLRNMNQPDAQESNRDREIKNYGGRDDREIEYRSPLVRMKHTEKQISDDSNPLESKINIYLNLDLRNTDETQPGKILTHVKPMYIQKKVIKEVAANDTKNNSKLETEKSNGTKKLDSNKRNSTEKVPSRDLGGSRKPGKLLETVNKLVHKIKGSENPATNQEGAVKNTNAVDLEANSTKFHSDESNAPEKPAPRQLIATRQASSANQPDVGPGKSSAN